MTSHYDIPLDVFLLSFIASSSTENSGNDEVKMTKMASHMLSRLLSLFDQI